MGEAGILTFKEVENVENNIKENAECVDSRVPETTESTQEKGAKAETKNAEAIRILTDAHKQKKLFNVDALWCLYLCSVLSGCNAEVFTFPLDLIKTRLQIQGEKADKIGAGPKKGMVGTAVGIVKEEGFFKLWNGMSAVCARHVVYSGIRLVTYRKLKELYTSRNPQQQTFPLWQAVTCGATAGAIGQFFATPADLIKVQLQMEGKRRLMGLPARINGFSDAFRKIYSAGGAKGLFKGWVPAVQRSAMVNIGDLAAYDLSKRFIQRKIGLPDTYVLHTLASSAAGFCGAILSTPADVIKSRIMNQPTDEKGRGLLYKGSLDCLSKAIKEEGVFALYKGFIPTWIRLGPWALVFWVTYEQLRILMGGDTF